MNKKIKAVIGIALIVICVTVAVMFFKDVNVAVLNPQGQIADKQRDLIMFTLMLSGIVVIPVFIMLAVFAWKFREGNKKSQYRPNWDNNKWLETIWWGIPCAIIAVLGVVTWQSSHDLDPYKSLDSNVIPIKVQVVALQWKWLFIYPDQHVASVNLLEIPEKTPINFTITADAPMNSFWIPSLGSQVYAMSGMSTQLHLMADTTGDYKGSSANISGKGFADMAFTARSTSRADFDTWVRQAKSAQGLDKSTYDQLAQPGTNKTPAFYSLTDNGLYDKIMMKYMAPVKQSDGSADKKMDDMMNMPGMEGM